MGASARVGIYAGHKVAERIREGSTMPPITEGEPRIGSNVRAARRLRGMSLETLAGLTGRSKGWLSKIEKATSRQVVYEKATSRSISI